MSAAALVTTARIAAGLSIAGDLFLAGTSSARGGAWRQATVGTLRSMALADLVTSVATAADGEAVRALGGAACWIVAALYWYGAWASWMWNAGYAYVVRLCLVVDEPNSSAGQHAAGQPGPAVTAGLGAVRLGTPTRWLLHTVCWGVPFGLVLLVRLLDDSSFGRASDIQCSLRTQTLGAILGFTSLLWVAMLYAAFVFVSVHLMLRRSVESAAKAWNGRTSLASLDAVRQRTKVWPRFLAYLLIFLLSQGPGVLWSVLGNPPWPIWVRIGIQALGNLNGFLNAVVYGLTNVAVYRHWMSLVPCCGRDDAALDSRGPSPMLEDGRARFLDGRESPPHPDCRASFNTVSPAWSIGSAPTWDQR